MNDKTEVKRKMILKFLSSGKRAATGNIAIYIKSDTNRCYFLLGELLKEKKVKMFKETLATYWTINKKDGGPGS